ncbi:hypothetical protein BJ742DRAFT_769249 [Cladochytrium replicatum]|nr:hypothetical protein BJ742DRAFT_769249 [Cladochytrium replicatum]
MLCMGASNQPQMFRERFDVYARKLSDEAAIAKIVELCDDLLGPLYPTPQEYVRAKKSSWQPSYWFVTIGIGFVNPFDEFHIVMRTRSHKSSEMIYWPMRPLRKIHRADRALKVQNWQKGKLDDGFALIIIYNQAALDQVGKFFTGKPGTDAKTVAKIEAFQGQVTGLASSLVGLFRSRNGGMEVDLQASFYMGDAAGRKRADASAWRATEGAPKDDFADTDLKFAKNILLEFFTPENYFYGHGGTNRNICRSSIEHSNPCQLNVVRISGFGTVNPSKGREAVRSVVFFGRMGSGKSSFYRYFSPLGYKHVNQDTLKTREKITPTVML